MSVNLLEKGKHVLVLGLGLSGRAMVERLLGLGHIVRGYDQNDVDLPWDIETFSGPNPDFESLYEGIDIVVTSPGLPWHSPILLKAQELNLEVLSEPELAYRLHQGDLLLVAVTGTNGKTTTTQLIHSALNEAFDDANIPALGNIGETMVGSLTDDNNMAVAELSSFQTHFIKDLTPQVAVLTSLADDHLDWHLTFEHYCDAKVKLLANAEVIIYNAQDVESKELIERNGLLGKSVAVDVEEFDIPLKLLGPHNRSNAALAYHAAITMGAKADRVEAALSNFAPQSHRVEEVANKNGIRWINDSKATNPQAAKAALEGFDNIHWIAGGSEKGTSFEPLAETIKEHVKHGWTIGVSGPAIAEVISSVGVPVRHVETLDLAIAEINKVAEDGDVVLLSPACASFDQFTSYADRGEQFVSLVNQAVKE